MSELLSIQLDEGHLLIPLHLVAEHRANVQAEKEGVKPHSQLWDRFYAEAFAYPHIASGWLLRHMDIDEIAGQIRFIPNHRFIGCLFDGYHSPEQASVTNAREVQRAGY